MKLLAALLLVACGGTSPAPAPVANTAPPATEPAAAATAIAETPPATPGEPADESTALDRNSGIVMAESVAGVTIGMTGAQLTKVLGKPTKTSGPTYEGEATGMYYVTWRWPGVDVNLSGDSKAGPFKASMIILQGPTYRTQRGIGIGSTVAEIEKAYAGLRDGSANTNLWVAGSIYGGVHMWITDDKVSGLFLGAGAF